MDYGNQQSARLHKCDQTIIPSYKFNCCGIIREWAVDVHRGGDRIKYKLNFQVWRPSSPVKEDTTGSYSLVGNNRVSISPRNGVISLPLSTQTPISFQTGDVLGLYVEDAEDNNGVVMLNSESELVWYAQVGEYSTSNAYSAGGNGQLATLTHAAPVISISISTSSCSNLPIATTLLPPLNVDGTDHNPPPEQTTTIDKAVSHDVPPSNSTANTKPIIPTPTTSSGSNDDSAEGNGLVASDNTANLTLGVIVSLVLIIVILTIAISISAVVLSKARKAREIAIPTYTNMAYGVTYPESLTELHRDLLNTTYEYPEVTRSSSMVYNAAYRTNHCSARNPGFGTDYRDASEAINNTST